VGILAAILLPSLYGADPGKMLAVVVFCASFVGMSAKARLSSELQIALAGIICGVLYIYTSPWLGGAGGKLGTLAFGSSISIWGLMGVWRRLSRKRTA
jgi:membrane associated rhomboid family serine protease